MKRIKTLYIIIALLIISFDSCQKDELIGGTAVQNMSGEWWLQTDGGSGGAFGAAYYKLSTYNTAANIPTEMWVDDSQSYYGLKAKVNVDPAGQTFTATNADEKYFNVKVTITKGIVKTGVAKGPSSGAVTDSISFAAVFSDDPKTTYKFKGYRRTRFAEDDH
jgi:hypothetical protein